MLQSWDLKMSNYTNKTIKAYEATAEEYAQKKAGKLSDSVIFLEKFVSLAPGKNILEIGFGLGQDAEWLIAHGFSYTGVDPVQAFADPLSKKFPNANILIEDIRKVNFPANIFDGIYAMASLLHLNNKDAKEVLAKCFKWLKSGGILFVSLKEGENSYVRGGRYFNLFTKEKLTKMLDKKFEILESSVDEARPYNTGKENWINFYIRKL